MEREFNKLFNVFGKRVGYSAPDSKDEYENAVWMPLADIKEDKNKYFVMLIFLVFQRMMLRFRMQMVSFRLAARGNRKKKTGTPNSTGSKRFMVVISDHSISLKKLKRIRLKPNSKMDSLL